MRTTPARPAPRVWVGISTGLALAAMALWFAPREAIDWQPSLALAQPWRLWTAAFVHLSPLHLQANLLGCAVVAVFGVVAGVPRAGAWAWLAAWPLAHAGLAMQPDLLHYGGLSGLLHAGVAVAALHLVWRQQGGRRLIGGAVLAGLVAKLVFEHAWVGPTQAVAGWDIRIAPLAHLTGAAAGLLCSVIAQVLAGRASSRESDR